MTCKACQCGPIRVIRYVLCILLTAVTAVAQTTAAPMYRVIPYAKGEKLLTKVAPAADAGYRVVLPGPFYILRLDTAPPDTYRYALADETNGPLEFINRLNEEGAHGYRWLPAAHLLEKEPHPHNYEYVLARHGKRWPAKAGDFSALASQGYRMCGDLYMIRELHAVSPAKGSALELEIAKPNQMALRPGKLIDKVRALAIRGYRYWAPSNAGLLMEKCPSFCNYEYDEIRNHDATQIEHDLNARGSAGFRWLPAVSASRSYVLERNASSTQTFAYRVLPADDASSLETNVNASIPEGFDPIGFMSHAGWKVQSFLILEKTVR